MLQPVKRFIRLKERKKQVFIHVPNDKYLRLRPTLAKKYYYEFTNSKHFLMNDFSIISDSSIVMIGGSFVENVYCESHKRISSTLLTNFALNGYDLDVLNAGVSGMTGLNALNLIINKITALNPKHIILFIPTNDGLCLNLENGLWNESKAYSNLLGIKHIDKGSKTNIADKMSKIINVYTLIINTCNIFNIGLTVCSSPMVDQDISDFYLIDKTSHASMCSVRNLVFDNILNHCQSLNVETIDLRPEFSNRQELFFDDVHTNELGSELIGNYLFEKIKHNFSNLISSQNTFTKKNIFDRIELKPKLAYSNSIPLNSNKKHQVTVSFHINCLGELNENNAIFCVQFDEFKSLRYEETGLKVSETFGSFKYIQTKSNARYRISYAFLVPSEIKEISIGFKSWKTETPIIIEDVNIFIQDL